ncbi:helix-turn-helix domain-containing protein [Flavobacterium anhuiense]|uniref:helix-turn-helix domain-containing protein n=1 Tax=Flavobacterium anhuiense TaxID=459526 RepID=UPI003D96DE5C
MFNNLTLILFFAGGTLGITADFALLFTKKIHYNGIFLVLFLFSLALISFYGLYLDTGSPVRFSLSSAPAESFIFLTAPCSFLYVKAVLSSSDKPQKYDLLHLVPFIIFFCFSLFEAIVFPEQVKADLPVYQYSTLLRLIWLSYAVFQTVKILNSSAVKKNDTAVRNKDLSFIRIFNLSVLILFSFLFLHHFLMEADGIIDRSGCIAAACTLAFITIALFFNLYIFQNQNLLDSIAKEPQEKNFKKEKIKDYKVLSEWLTPERRKEYLLRIDYNVNFQKCFLNKGICLKDLAEETGISLNIISHLINSEFGCSFKDYINSKRIDYFIENANDPSWKDLNVLGMALKCGFGSRTSCFRAFLKHTGKPPSYYFEDIKVRAGA